MRTLFWCFLFWPGPPRRQMRTRTSARQAAECLESRQLLTIAIQFDYSQDANNFFENTARRQILELAGETLGNRLNDHLLPITPGGDNTWSLTSFNSSTGGSFTLNDQLIPENTVLVFVGSRNISSLAVGGPGGYSSSGSDAWNDLVVERGQAGMLNTPETDFGLWGGAMTFDDDANWYFGMSADGQGSSQYDFFSVALHELGHVLGIGTAGSWDNQVSGNFFVGPHAVAEYGAEVPLSGSSHFKKETMNHGQEVAMDPDLQVGTRKLFTKLDYAALADVGWELNDFGGGVDPPIPPPKTYTINVDPNLAHSIVIADDDVLNNGRVRLILDGQASSFLNPSDELIINGGSKNDSIVIQSLDAAFAAKITVNAGTGNDRVDASAVAVAINVLGGAGRDTLTGGSGADTLLGGNDDDSLTGNDGDDSLEGDAGSDKLFGGGSKDVLSGGDGNDNLQGQSGNDTISGGVGQDLINGGDDDDSLSGEIGRDTLLGGLGNDTLDGGVENDSLQGQDGNDLLQGDDGNDNLQGQSGKDTVFGGAGQDSLNGGDGNDSLSGESGRDTLLGGLGDDSLDGGVENDNLKGQDGNDLLQGGDGNDVLTGLTGADTLQGNAGDDALNGGLGDDSLLGGEGNDRIVAEGGNDTLNGGEGKDTLQGGIGNDALSGSSGNDSLLGEAGDDTLFGGAGDDRLRGGVGNDLLRGGLGNDRVDGESGADTVSGGNGAKVDLLDTIVPGVDDVVDERFVFEADWIDGI